MLFFFNVEPTVLYVIVGEAREWPGLQRSLLSLGVTMTVVTAPDEYLKKKNENLVFIVSDFEGDEFSQIEEAGGKMLGPPAVIW